MPDILIERLASEMRSPGAFSRELIEEAAKSANIDVLANLREIFTYHGERLPSNVNRLLCYRALVTYYVKRMAGESGDAPSLHTPFEAARELNKLLSHWLSLEDPSRFPIRNAVDAVTKLFLESDAETQNLIETGFLEHVFEEPRSVPWFSVWEHDPRLSDAYQAALRWARAHRS